VPRCRALIGAAGKLRVAFHRAFDLSGDPRRALEDVISLGCERLLTSGARETALAGAALIRELIAQAAGRIEVMPGAGIGAANIAAVRAQTGAREFHSSARRQLPSRMTAVGLGMDGGEWRTDNGKVRAMVAALRAAD
jgi:copper homeostasis protein